MFNEKYMRLAIELAKKGTGKVNPNPLVGAVVVKDDRIIGQGYHAKYGELHAERDAFRNLSEQAVGAEMYVTLEPCCHQGKQPPCVEAIVEQGIKKVYVGSDDPNCLVAGKGIEYLREHGIEVETGILKEECDELNPVFFHYITQKTPYVVMKYAMTMDGKIAAYTGKSQWITGEEARAHTHETRNWLKGIMIGSGTLIMDDPMLTCRIPNGRNPVRIICDTNLKIPYESNIVQTARDIPTIVACGSMIPKENGKKKLAERLLGMKSDKARKLEEMGIKVIAADRRENKLDGRLDLKDLMNRLGEEGIDGILLEGGGTLNYSALEAGIVDEVQVYIAPKILGGKDAITGVEGKGFAAPDLAARFSLKKIEHFGDDILLTYRKKE